MSSRKLRWHKVSSLKHRSIYSYMILFMFKTKTKIQYCTHVTSTKVSCDCKQSHVISQHVDLAKYNTKGTIKNLIALIWSNSKENIRNYRTEYFY